MNIEQRPPKSDPPKKPLICELESKPNKLKYSDTEVLVPDFNLLKVDEPQEYYASEIDLKNVCGNYLSSYVNLIIFVLCIIDERNASVGFIEGRNMFSIERRSCVFNY